MTALEVLGEYAATRVRGSVTADVQELLKLHAIDTVAAWIAGSKTAEAQQLLPYRADLERAQPGLLSEIAINCALVRLTEVDDIHLASMTTPGAFIVPAALSIAASRPQVDAQSLCEAVVAGYEAMTRVGAAINGPMVLYRGIWPSYLSAAFGVAAVAARLMDLTVTQTAHALALALNMSGPGVGQHGAPTTSRWLAAGSAARNGVLAAHAAGAGFTADVGILDGKYFSGVLDVTPDIAALTRQLGEQPALQDVSFKPWCAARQTMAATQAFTEITAREVNISGITAVEAIVPPLSLRMIDHGIVENDRLSRLTSMPYQIAIAALAPNLAFDLVQADPVPAALQGFMAKVKVLPDEALMDGFPSLWRARVRVQADGAWHEHQIAQIPGDPGRPFTQSDVCEKFHRLADKIIGPDRVERIIGETIDVLDGRREPKHLLASIASALT
jgi:2-methylcitrate dehydratase PrpD